jgi:mannose-6-phosphate isomerase class I
MSMTLPTPWRKTTQHLMPARVEATGAASVVGRYTIYPAHELGAGQIEGGFAALAQRLVTAGTATIDGYPGVLWQDFRERLDAALLALGIRAHWVDVGSIMKASTAIDALIAPFLGGDDPIFGTRFTGNLADFFEPAMVHSLRPDPAAPLSIVYGCGAALVGWTGVLVYVDVPKNEIQFRQRAGCATCLGANQPLDPKPAYKRSYFIDWVAANRHKLALHDRIDLLVDGQRPDSITFARGDAIRRGLAQLATGFFRVRPWFEPGPWGGQWIRQQMPQLAQDVPNYAWSFELIVPENGLVFSSNGWLLEISFDFLMHRNPHDIIGESADAFGYEFPIRFDFLDTFAGGNLSVQCHPRPAYIRQHFGELFTQDETYYILEAGPDARCFLGFQDDIDPLTFRTALEESFTNATPVAIDRFVQSHPAHKHDLFLIPNGTIHCSGTETLVLEISATPYIFTFKMYDWMRLDLDGRPRPLNITRAFENLYFDRKGTRIHQEFIASPYTMASGPGWELIHQPTHRDHFYDVHRYRLSGSVDVQTDGSCHVLSLVEGRSVLLETNNGASQRFHYAETFVVPAAAGAYRLTSEDGSEIHVVKAFVKPRSEWAEGVVA